MNTNPDDHTLLLWLEDELAAEEQALVDLWASNHPLWWEKRESSRRWRSHLPQIMSHSSEIPQGEFFQARLFHSIATSASSIQASRTTVVLPSKWILPLSIAAAMVLGFWGGNHWHHRMHRAKTLVTYTPEQGVKAEFFETSPAEGTVIVLNGVEALPDEFAQDATSSVSTTDSHHGAETQKKEATLITP